MFPARALLTSTDHGSEPTGTGPTLDWSVIQPQVFGAGCDVVLFLDCCYAGQAARTSSRNAIELLAATDKDNWTPIGHSTWPSFTAVLIHQLTQMLAAEESHASIPGLHRRMLCVDSGLRKQPFYACMSDPGTPGSIHLPRFSSQSQPDHGMPSLTTSWADDSFLGLRLRLLKPFDPDSAQSFLKWATRDASPDIQDVEIVDGIIHQAKAANDIASELMSPRSNENPGSFLPFLTPKGQKRTWELFDALKSSIFASRDSTAVGDVDAVRIIDELRQKSDTLLSFVSDCVASLDLTNLENLNGNSAANIKDLRDRILMPLTLLADPAS